MGVLSFLLAAGLLFAEPDWPAFRGPDSNPIAPNGKLPEKWSKTENIEWTAEIPGRGWSSPIVNGRDIFVTSVTTDGASKKPQTGTEYSNEYAADLMKQGLSMKEVLEKVNQRDIEMPNEVTVHYFLYSIDLQTGKTNWKREFYGGHPPGGRHRKNSFASETPITDGKLVYVYVANLGLYAFDLKGKEVWHTALEAYPIYLDFGTGASPALLGNLLIIVNDNDKQQFIAAFDKNTGKQVWRTDRQISSKEGPMKSGWATPYIWKTPQRTEIITVGPGTAISYDADGKELWRLSGMSVTPIPTPFSVDGLLYLNAGRSKSIYAIKPGASGDITPAESGKQNDSIAWAAQRSGTYLPTEVAYNGGSYVLGETGIFSRIDAKTGALTYRARIPGADAFTSSPWAYNGKIFCLDEEGRTFVIAAGDKFELLQTNALEEMAQATPAIAGDRLLLRTETKLYSIRNKN
jgi:outer membrane protein assembly factor BamB